MKEKMMMRAERLNELVEEEGKNFTVKYVQRWKINKMLEGYALLKPGKNTYPIVYNHESIIQMSDKELIEYMENILEGDQPTQEEVINLMKNTDYIKGNLYMSLISLDRNIEGLKQEDIFFIPLEDMAITFYIRIETEDSIGKLTIKNGMLEAIHLTKKEALLYAKRNLLKHCDIIDIEKIIQQYIHPDYFLENETDKTCKMLIVTTKNRVEGAALMLVDDVMKKLEKYFSSRYLILPSSIHEFIAIPYTSYYTISEWEKIVHEINATVLSPNEYLSDSVFVWENGELHKA